VKLKSLTEKSSDSGMAGLPLSVVLSPEEKGMVISDPSVLLGPKFLSAPLRDEVHGLELRLFGTILTKRRYVNVNTLLLKVDESILNSLVPFYEVKVCANDLEAGKRAFKKILEELKLPFHMSCQNSAGRVSDAMKE
jgi:uncharacterized protein YjbK